VGTLGSKIEYLWEHLIGINLLEPLILKRVSVCGCKCLSVGMLGPYNSTIVC
jgi:hypothetical protein